MNHSVYERLALVYLRFAQIGNFQTIGQKHLVIVPCNYHHKNNHLGIIDGFP